MLALQQGSCAHWGYGWRGADLLCQTISSSPVTDVSLSVMFTLRATPHQPGNRKNGGLRARLFISFL